MKKIFITDLDHTFLRNDLSVSDYTKSIWNQRAKNDILTVATARTYMKTVQFLDGIFINAPMILLDGALIATREKKVIDTKFISQELGNEIISAGAKHGIYPFILSLDDTQEFRELFLYDEILNADQAKVLTRYSSDDNLVKFSGIQAMKQNFKIVYMGEEKLLKELHAELQSRFSQSLKFIIAPEAYVGCWFLTILHPQADKAHGIQSVSEYLDLDLGQLTVFGDNFNDIGMFKLSATSVAIANAQEGVKEAADIVLEHTNEEDGVAKYLEGLGNG